MAILFSENQINYARKKFYGSFYVTKPNLTVFDKFINKSLIFIYLFRFTLVNLKRLFCRISFSIFRFKSEKKIENFSYNVQDVLIEKASDDLKSKNFTFIENFLSTESYKYLIDNWPDINYFNHHKQIIKHFNSGFRYSKGQPIEKTFSKFNNFYALKKFYEYLLSNEFSKFYNKLINFEDKNYELCAISSKMATKNSYLIPHIDGIFKKNKSQHYNFIYFLDGYEENPDLGGATGFYKDNEFKLPIFVPHTFKNSLIIYNQSEDFYHGFKTINCPKGIYRKSIGFQIKPV
mgnify:CR=1 FL=1